MESAQVPHLLLFAALCATAGSARTASTYYFASGGNDASDCLSVSTPCRSLDRLNGLPQGPGVSFLLRRGDRFPGSILLQASGQPDAPVTVAAYGEGAPPVIDGGLRLGGWTLAERSAAAWIYSTDVPAQAYSRPFALIADERILPLARFPDSGYARVSAADSESLTLDSSAHAGRLELPAGAQLRARAGGGILSNRRVRSFDPATGRLAWDGPLPSPLAPGAGILLLDFPGALGRPWEWYCYPPDAPAPDGRRLRLALPPGDAPGSHNVRIADAGFGIKGSGLAHIRIEGIDFENQVSAALYFYDCAQVAITGCGIRNAVLTGIEFRGAGLTATGNSISGAALAGIAAGPDPDAPPLGPAETSAFIAGNRIARIGLFSSLGNAGPDDDGAMGIGIRTRGDGDRILGNRIDSTACDGVRFLGRRTSVEDNLLLRTCLRLDPAGAIHAGPPSGTWGSEGSRIKGNLIANAPGNAAGTARTSTRGYGIFLDGTSEIAVVANFIAGADVGVRLEGGRGEFVGGNLLYANRRHPLRAGGRASAASGGRETRLQENLIWNIGESGTGGPPKGSASGPCEAGSDSACSARSTDDLVCTESGGTAACGPGLAARFSGMPPMVLAERLRNLRARLETEALLPDDYRPALDSLTAP
jgi:hypothetical protein